MVSLNREPLCLLRLRCVPRKVLFGSKLAGSWKGEQRAAEEAASIKLHGSPFTQGRMVP